MKKRKLAVILASIMLLSTGVTAFASNIEMRAPTCPMCNGGMEYGYVILSVNICRQCGGRGCYEQWWGWSCKTCGEFSRTSLKETVCRNN